VRRAVESRKLKVESRKSKVGLLFALLLLTFNLGLSTALFGQGTVSGAGSIAGAGIASMVSGSTARHFNGSDTDYLTHADDASLRSPSTALTVAFWARATSGTQNTYAGYVDKRYGSYDSWRVDAGSSTSPHAQGWVYTSSGQTYTASSNLLTTGTWYFMALRWASGGKLNLDVYNSDGSLFQHVESTGANTGSISYDTSALYIGRLLPTTHGFQGDIAQAYVDNTSLSDGDLATLRTGTQPHAASAAYWPIGLGSPDPDQSGNGNDLTVNGTTIVAGP
jgi:hypothetical protein